MKSRAWDNNKFSLFSFAVSPFSTSSRRLCNFSVLLPTTHKNHPTTAIITIEKRSLLPRKSSSASLFLTPPFSRPPLSSCCWRVGEISVQQRKKNEARKKITKIFSLHSFVLEFSSKFSHSFPPFFSFTLTRVLKSRSLFAVKTWWKVVVCEETINNENSHKRFSLSQR